MFRRILVAMDNSEAARSAFVFAAEWSRSFDTKVWFIQLARESQQRHCGVVTDVQHGGRRVANTFSVSGATQRVRNQQLVSAIAEAAATYRADALVVGFDQQRMTQGRFHRSLRDQLTEATNIPVIVPPRMVGHGAATPTPPPLAIALGAGPGVRVPDAAMALAHV